EGKLERTVELGDEVMRDLCVSPAGTMAASVAESERRLVTLFDPTTGRSIRRIPLPEDAKPESAAFGPAGRWPAGWCWGGRVRLYDPHSGEFEREFNGSSQARKLVTSPAGRLICLPAFDRDEGDPSVFDPDSGLPSGLPFPLAGVRHVTFDPSGTLA